MNVPDDGVPQVDVVPGGCPIPWLDGLEQATAYHTDWFADFILAATGGERRVVLARRGTEIVGFMPYFTRTDPELGSVLNSQPWFGSHGGCLLRDPEDHNTRQALLHAFSRQASAADVLSATVVMSHAEMPHTRTYQQCLRARFLDDRIGQITTLPEAGDELEARFREMLSYRTSRAVKKAQRYDLTEIVGDQEWMWDFLHAVHEENMTAIGGRPKPRAHFDAMRSCIPASRRRLAVAMEDGVPIAGLLTFQYGDWVEYITPVIRMAARPKQPLSFLIWRAMLDAARDRRRFWNWGGTWRTQASLLEFKKGWSADENIYDYIITCAKDAVNTTKIKKDIIMSRFNYYYVMPMSVL